MKSMVNSWLKRFDSSGGIVQLGVDWTSWTFGVDMMWRGWYGDPLGMHRDTVFSLGPLFFAVRVPRARPRRRHVPDFSMLAMPPQ